VHFIIQTFKCCFNYIANPIRIDSKKFRPLFNENFIRLNFKLNSLQLLLDKIPPDQYLLLDFLYNALVSSEQYPNNFISLRPMPIPTILGCLVYHLVQVFSFYLGGQEMIYAHELNRKTMACREVAENQEDNEPNWVCH